MSIAAVLPTDDQVTNFGLDDIQPLLNGQSAVEMAQEYTHKDDRKYQVSFPGFDCKVTISPADFAINLSNMLYAFAYTQWLGVTTGIDTCIEKASEQIDKGFERDEFVKENIRLGFDFCYAWTAYFFSIVFKYVKLGAWTLAVKIYMGWSAAIKTVFSPIKTGFEKLGVFLLPIYSFMFELNLPELAQGE